MLSVQLLEQAETIVANEAEWQDIKNTLIMTVKRMPSAAASKRPDSFAFTPNMAVVFMMD